VIISILFLMAKKKCINCGSFKVVKNIRSKTGSQLYLCKRCGTQFVRRYRSVKWQKELFQEYIFGKQTLKQLATRHGKSIKTIRKYLDSYQVKYGGQNSQPVKEALQMAINLPEIAQTYYNGKSESTPEPLTSGFMNGWGYPFSQWPASLQAQYAYNPTQAKAINVSRLS